MSETQGKLLRADRPPSAPLVSQAGWREALGERFESLGARDKKYLQAGALALALVLLVGVGVLPATRHWLGSTQAHQRMQAQLDSMRTLQERAQLLQAAPKLAQSDAIQRLQALQPVLGASAQLSVGEQNASLSLQAVPASSLATWLVRARLEAHAVPLEARLVRQAQGDTAVWSGTLRVSLPPR
jgi:general secretion pathway protein M